MKNMLIIFLHLAMTFTIWGCLIDEEPTLFTSPELQVYFDRFRDEAALRGIVVDFDSAFVAGMITNLEGNISGQCQFNTVEPDRVLIDKAYWSNATDFEKEFIVFHELGHCYLNRQHLDLKNDRGICMSIMHSGETGCNNAYGPLTRTQYLNELFLN